MFSWVMQESPVQVAETFKGASLTPASYNPTKSVKSSEGNSQIWLNSDITFMSRR